jgi:molecular chaperone DnaJ
MGSGARFSAGGRPGQPGGFEDVFGGMFNNGGQRAGFRPNGGGGGFDDIFGGMFGQSSGGFQGFGGPTPGRDLTTTVTLDFITAIKGDTVVLQGADGKSINTRIPEGVSDGQKIRLKGKGEPSPDGGPRGDLILTVKVSKHPVFEREGINLRVDVPVTFVEATLGATIEVPTLGGEPVKLRVAAGTPGGRVLRVKGRGVTTSKGTGDLLASVVIAVPGNLPAAAKKALEEFAAAMPSDNPRLELLEKAGD